MSYYCPICLDDIDPIDISPLVTCSHTFHRTCIKTWNIYGGYTCPMCRTCLPSSLFDKLMFIWRIHR